MISQTKQQIFNQIVIPEGIEKQDGEITAVPKKLVYDVKAFMKAFEEDGSQTGEETKIDNSRLSGKIFTFRLAVPASVDKKYAKVVHTSDDGKADIYYCKIHEENGEKYIEISVRHFSDFALTFQDTAPVESGTGSGGRSNTNRKVYNPVQEKTGEWKQDSNGWWYCYRDGTWPSGQWVELEWNGEKQWYYFSTDTVGPKGAMVTNTTTPDGYRVGADGAWIQ